MHGSPLPNPVSPARRCLLALLLAAVAALILAPAAGAAGDPVKTGSLKLRLSGALKGQLAHSGVKLGPKALSLKGGRLDPLAGTGVVKLRGKLTFKHGGEKVRLKKLRATLGPKGTFKAAGMRLFSLRGGTLSRQGFGAALDGVRAGFTREAARKLTRKLELDTPLHRSVAGTLSVSEQPRTVEILSGTATLNPATGPGSVNAKLAAHCVDPAAGMTVIAPGTQPAGPGTALVFPINSGTISPVGTDGVVQQSGGMQIANGGSGLAPGCSATNTLTVRITDFSSDLLRRLISAHAAISGSGSPLGNLDAAVSFPLDISDTSVNPDPFGLSLSSTGTALRLDSGAATEFNAFFQQPTPANPALEFAAGDLIGTVGISVKVR